MTRKLVSSVSGTAPIAPDGATDISRWEEAARAHVEIEADCVAE